MPSFETETNEYADVLLPAALWTESEGVMVNSERNLTLLQPAVEAPGQALPDWQIIARIACEMGFSDAFTYDSRRGEYSKRSSGPGTLPPATTYAGSATQRLRADPAAMALPTRTCPDDRNPIRYLNDGVSQTLG